MLKLSNKSFEIISQNLKEKARPLDIARFNYHLDKGSQENLIKEIKKYQNENGGFGNALEPDFRLPLSTPMATSIALRHLSKVDSSKSAHTLIKKAVSYLDKMTAKGQIHQNNAARKKSKMTKYVDNI
jgi:hypothetical protein